jgi:hypothetical protein
MKKFYLVCITILILPFLFADSLSQSVTLSITTAVPSYLVHGFLDDTFDANIVSETSVGNAFNQNGVNLTYAIKTNVTSNLIVSATLTPFVKLGDSTSTVGIDSFSVEAEEKSLVGGLYQILNLDPSVQGMRMYSYTLTVKANQEDVAAATSGDYESTLSIDIAAN